MNLIDFKIGMKVEVKMESSSIYKGDVGYVDSIGKNHVFVKMRSGTFGFLPDSLIIIY